MDLAKRFLLQNALSFAASKGRLIAIERKNGRVTVVRREITCYENHIEATDRGGQSLTISYADIEGVSIS